MKKEQQEAHYAEWVKLIDEQERSGLPQKEFCQQKNISVSKLIYYRYQFKKKNKPIKNNPAPSFSPVKIVSKESSEIKEVRVSLPNGFQLSFSSHFDSVRVKQLIEVLLSC